MTVYRCPRADLRCDELFGSSGDLDHHYRWTHGYRRAGRYTAAFRPQHLPPVGGRSATRARRPTAALPPGRPTATPGATVAPSAQATPTAPGGEPSGFGPAATAGAVRARHARREPTGMGALLRRFSRHH